MFEENITIVAAHPDDEVLGMGGTINKLCKLPAVGCRFKSKPAVAVLLLGS